MLIVVWPGAFAGLGTIALILAMPFLLLGGSNVVIDAVTLSMCALVVVVAVIRGVGAKVVIRDDRVVVVNPLRTYTFTCDQPFTVVAGSYSIAPTEWPALEFRSGKQVVTAAGSVIVGDAELRLSASEDLCALALKSGGSCTLPPDSWGTMSVKDVPTWRW